jgi:flagellar capping protein FliD
MSPIRLPGLVTGIDTNKLIAQLMALQRYTLNRYEERQSLWEEKKDALNTLETKLSTLRTTLRVLSDAGELRAFSVASSDSDYLTAEASYNAFEGNHTVVINQLANAERWVHTAGEEYAENYVGEGTFVYSYNYKETSITTTATTTLEDLVGLINNDANNPGVTATLLYYNGAYHLVLNGNEAGTDYQIKVNSGRTEVWKSGDPFTRNSDNATLNTKITELDQFSGSVSGGSPYIRITGTDHFGVAVTQTDLTVTENMTIAHLISEINDAFDGAAKAVFEDGKIILTDSEDGVSSISTTLQYFDDGTGSSLDNLAMSVTTEGADSVADLANYAPSGASSFFTLSQAAQDSKIKVDGFPSTSAVSEVQTVSLSGTLNPGDTYTLTYRGETTSTLAYDADAAAIRTALGNLSTINFDDITVSGPLANNQTFTFASSLGDVDLIMINDASLSCDSVTISETTKGSDGYICRSSNTVDDVIHGVAMHLHAVTDSNGKEITLTRDIDSVKEKLNSMINAYNLAVNYIKEKTSYDNVSKVAGVLQGDYTVTDIGSQIRNPLIFRTSGFIIDIDTFLTPGLIGLEIDRDGLLSLDTNVFDEAIAEDYLGALAIIGADKTGSSTSDTVEFYGASSRYTTAGSYDVKVVVSGGVITSAKIKLSTESTYRDATVDGNIVTGDTTFNDNGDPVYPENSLQLSVDLSQDGTYGTDENPIVVRVKQGFTGAIEDAIDRVLKTTSGSLQIAQKYADDTLDGLEDKIEDEKKRLDARETRLIMKFARLEATLAAMQTQMAGLFGSGLV